MAKFSTRLFIASSFLFFIFYATCADDIELFALQLVQMTLNSGQLSFTLQLVLMMLNSGQYSFVLQLVMMILNSGQYSFALCR